MKRNKLIILILILTLSFGIIISLYFFSQRNSKINAEIQEGMNVLETMEEKDVIAMEEDIDFLKRKAVDANDYPQLFSSSVVLGDSIAEGLGLFNYLKPSSLVAGLGKSTTLAMEDVPKLIALKPQNIFIELGLNDISDANDGVNTFTKNYEKLIDAIQLGLPKTKIYICSIFPVTDSLIAERPEFSKIPEYNAALVELAKKKNVEYLDTYTLGNANAQLHDPDGIHYFSAFYPLWLDTLVNSSVLSKRL
ncbi:MAG: GDSL-type esterase/lipase family protein [Eubacteriaceae bacterium]